MSQGSGPTLETVVLEEEEVVWTDTPLPKAVWADNAFGWFVLGAVLLFTTALPIGAGAFLYADWFGIPVWVTLVLGFVVFPLLVTAGFVFRAYQFIQHAEYAVTDQRFIAFGGIVGRDVSSVRWENVRDVEVDVGLTDKLFDTGTVRVIVPGVEGDGQSSGAQFRYLAEPYEVLEHVERQVHAVPATVED